MKLIKKICYICYRIISIIKIIIESIMYKDKIYLFGIPIHGNLGDQAILWAEEQFLKDNIKNIKIIEVESKIVVKHIKTLKKLVKNSTILMHGGGFLGSLWFNEEEMFRTTLRGFPNNQIIVFPQTVYFGEDEEGKNILKESIKIYQNHKKLVICCREKFSYQYMKENFPKCNVILIPDMVLYLNSIKQIKSKENILFCIRQDKEKVQYNFEEIRQVLEKNGKIDYTDTVIRNNVYRYSNRMKILNKKLNQFAQYKLVVTDRLHGMVFALLANTPCLVFENKSYKIKGVYEWIKNIKKIQLYNEENALIQIEELLAENSQEYNNEELRKKYNPLIQLIQESINKEGKK